MRTRSTYNQWRIRWKNAQGKRQSETFASYDDAAPAIKRHEVEVEEIKRGFRQLTLPNKTFNDICDYWLENRASRKRSGSDDASIIRRDLRPTFGVFQLIDVTVEQVDRLITSRSHRNSKTVHNHLTLLKFRLFMSESLGWAYKIPKNQKPKVSLFL